MIRGANDDVSLIVGMSHPAQVEFSKETSPTSSREIGTRLNRLKRRQSPLEAE